jgi:glucose-1-phosphatase
MTRKGIKNLVFDYGNVLVNLDKSLCIRRFEEIGLNNVGELINDSYKAGFFQRHEKGLISGVQFRSYIRSLIENPVTDDQIDGAWNSFLGIIPPSKLEMLLQLRNKYMVYLLSNTNDIHWKWSCEHIFPYNGFTIDSYFEKTYLSFQMKMVKPDSEIFEAVINDSGIDPKETLFIDDSVDNCLTAESLGFSTFVSKPDTNDWCKLFNK